MTNTAPATGGSASDGGATADVASGAESFADELPADANECQGAGEWIRASLVLDGDTIIVDDGKFSKVRLLGVSAPEIAHPPKPAECFGVTSWQWVKKWLQVDQPNLTNVYVCMLKDANADNADAFGRLLRYVYLRDSAGQPVQLNARLIRMGGARVYRDYSKGLRYETALIARENAAKDQQLGGWKTCGWTPLK